MKQICLIPPQSVEMVKRIGSDNVYVHLDTYHMHIERAASAMLFEHVVTILDISTSASPIVAISAVAILIFRILLGP